LIMRSEPFGQEESFDFFFSKKGGGAKTAHRLHVPYSKDRDPHFRVAWNDGKKAYEIERLSTAKADVERKAGARFSFVETVFAAEAQQSSIQQQQRRDD